MLLRVVASCHSSPSSFESWTYLSEISFRFLLSLLPNSLCHGLSVIRIALTMLSAGGGGGVVASTLRASPVALYVRL